MATYGYSSDVATGGTVSANGHDGIGVNLPESAFDDDWDGADDAHRWLYSTTPAWLKYDLGSGNSKIVEKYKFNSYPDSADFHPSSWTFEGSHDDSNWNVLDTQSSISWSPDNEIKEFTFSNAAAYRYYKINITANSGAGNLIGEMEMMESLRPLLSAILIE